MPNFCSALRRIILPVFLIGFQGIALGQYPLELPGKVSWQFTIQEHLRALASDSMEGRRTGTAGNIKAANYIRDHFMRAGLQMPQGKGMEGYFNPFEYTIDVQADPGNKGVIVRSVHGRKDTTHLVMNQNFTPLGFTGPGNVAADIVFVGYGISAPDLKYDEYEGVNVEGKIALMLRHSPDGTNPHGDFATHSSFARKVIAAREHGAAAIIFVDSPSDGDILIPLKLDRSFTNAGIAAVSVHASVFADMRDARGRTLAQMQRDMDSTRTPTSFAPAGYSAVIATAVRVLRATVPNVIGILPGNDPKLREEFVVLGAHFDHLGRGGEGSLKPGDTAIHYGADDNASGAAGLIVLADYFARMRSNGRSIIFAAFNGEEEGLLGSAAMVAHPPFPLEKVVAMINMDMIGRLDSNKLIVYGIGTSPGFKGLLDSINNNRLSLRMVDDGYGPSDHTSFYLKDIPVLAMFTGTHTDYHRSSDTWEKINYTGAADILDFTADIMNWLTHSPERLAFTKTQNNATRTGTGFRVYVGTIPDYAYEGKGLRLSGVSPGGPAEKAGLREGDILVRMGPKTINNIYDYTYALGEFRPKEKVELEFLRDGASKTTMVELGTR